MRVAAVSIAGTWGFYVAFWAVRLKISLFPRPLLLIEWHFFVASVGACLTWLLYLVIRRLERAAIAERIAAALILAVPATIMLALVNYEFLFVLAPARLWAPRFLAGITLKGVVAHTIMEMYLVFAGWAFLYTSVWSALESQDAQRRAAIAQAESQEARLRALRYQLNPHFLFNALNTVSALVMRGDKDGAERTIQALSLFLRSTLETKTLEDVTLGEELELQRLYLDIEKVRFGERLRVHMCVPDELRSALLPPLLLQPLVENVIRHAVTRADEPVTMTIAAAAVGDRLDLVVEDDGRADVAETGAGIGLRNAASRLVARYGAAARCSHGPRPGGGFRVELALPLCAQLAPT